MLSTISSQSAPLSSTIIRRAGELAKENVVPSQSNPELITPEDVNRAVGTAEANSDARQQSSAQESETKRNAVLQLNAQQQQQQLIEIYIESYSGEEVESSGSLSAQTLAAGINQVEGLSAQQKLEALLDNRPSTQPIEASELKLEPISIYQTTKSNAANTIGLSLQA